MQRKIFALVLVFVLIIGIAIGFSFSQLLPSSAGSFLQGEQQEPVKVTVVAGQIVNTTFENGHYTFTFYPDSGHGAKFYVITPNPISGTSTTTSYTPDQGAVYYVSGIKMTVSEVHSNYIILLIESNVPNNETP